MDLKKIIADENTRMDEENQRFAPGEHLINTVESVIAVLRAYETFGADKRGLSYAVGNALKEFIQYAICKEWTDELYMHPEAIFEAEERGYMYGGVKGTALEVIGFLPGSHFYSEAKHPLADTAAHLSTKPHKYTFGMAWGVFFTMLRVEFKYDFGDMDGTELETIYYDVMNGSIIAGMYEPCIYCKAAVDTEHDPHIDDAGTGEPWCVNCAQGSLFDQDNQPTT